MKVRTQNLFIATATAGLMLAGGAHAQYYGQPLTGAGSTVQPSQQWQQQQHQWQAQTSYPTHRPIRELNGNKFMWQPELGNWVPIELSPKVIEAIPTPSPMGCAFGAKNLARFGGVSAGVGCGLGAFGVPTSKPGAASKLFKVEKAY